MIGVLPCRLRLAPRLAPRLAANLAAGLAAVLVAGTSSAQEACPTLAVLRLGTTQVLVGQRHSGSPCDATGPLGALSNGRPSWEATSEGSLRRAWSPLAPLGFGATGLPFTHRDGPWILDLGDSPPGGTPFYTVLPMGAELGMSGSRLECLADVRDVAASALDDWTFAIVEQDSGGDVLLRTVSSSGGGSELEIERQESWRPTWRDGARLLAVSGTNDELALFARDPSGEVEVAFLPPRAKPAPPLAAPASAIVSAVTLARGPAVVVVDGGVIRLAVLGMDAWMDSGSLPLPGSGAGAVSLGRADEDGIGVVAAVATRSGVVVATHDGAAWSEPSVIAQPTGTAPKAMRHVRTIGPEEIERRMDRSALAIIAVAAGIAIAAALVAARHVRLKLAKD